MTGIVQDLRYAVRGLGRSRAFTLTAILTLGICIGANVALFAVAYRVLLRPLPVPDSDRIILIYNSYPKAGAERAGATAPDYFDRRQYMDVFSEHALFNTRNPSVEISGTPQRIHAMHVTPSFFRLVQVPPQIGRGFTDQEGTVGQNRVVILSEGLSRQLFSDGHSIGRSIRIDGAAHTVVGVMPAHFTLIESNIQAWIPLAFTDQQKTQRYSNNWAYLGRLRPGATLAEAQTQLDALNAANLERYPDTKLVLAGVGFHSVAVRLQDDLVREVRPTLYLLWGGAACVLLIGCVNIASLVLVRSRGRLQEVATRLALGAGARRIIGQFVIENTIVTVLAGSFGLLIGHAALQLFGASVLDRMPWATGIGLDAATVGYTMAACVLIGAALGVVPALGGLPLSLSPLLRAAGRTGTLGHHAHTTRRLLVVTEMALAFVLLVGAGLLFSSFQRVLAIDPGFAPDGVLTASVNLPPARYAGSDELRRFTDDALAALRASPGVLDVGATSSIPFAEDFNQDVLLPEGYSGQMVLAAFESTVTPSYFETMRVRLISGRFFDEGDTASAPRVVIVDERLARRYWPGVDPVGRRMYTPSDPKDPLAVTEKTQWHTVVGVVAEIKLRGFVEGVGNVGAYFRPQAQSPRRVLTFAIRTAGDPASRASAVRHEIARLDRELPLFDVQTMVDRADRSLTTRRSAMWLAMSFGLVALLLCAIGIYGVLAYAVSQRTKEIGIRVALGSTTSRIFGLIAREGALLIAIGLAVGALGALALKQVIERLLFETRFSDPFVFASAIAVLVIAAMAACAIPARRAARVDPLVALRYE
jgi:predicted permease